MAGLLGSLCLLGFANSLLQLEQLLLQRVDIIFTGSGSRRIGRSGRSGGSGRADLRISKRLMTHSNTLSFPTYRSRDGGGHHCLGGANIPTLGARPEAGYDISRCWLPVKIPPAFALSCLFPLARSSEATFAAASLSARAAGTDSLAALAGLAGAGTALRRRLLALSGSPYSPVSSLSESASACAAFCFGIV